MPKIHDLKGKKYNKLTPIRVDKTTIRKDISRYWWCKCDCGNEVSVRTNHILSGETKSCGCLTFRHMTESPNWKGSEHISGAFVGKFKKYAKQRNIDFDIDVNDIEKIWERQNGKCFYTGVDFVLLGENSIDDNKNSNMSLDRFDSDKPYIKDNLNLVLKEINIMKNKYTHERFLELCNLISEKYNGNIT